MKFGMALLLVAACPFALAVCGGQETKTDNPALSSASVSASSTPAVDVQRDDGTVKSLAGRWKNENKNERGVWLFDSNGRCIIRSSGLVEQKGRYTYTGKELVINFDSGTTTYRILDNREPRLVLTMRWGDLYNLTNVLVRMP